MTWAIKRWALLSVGLGFAACMPWARVAGGQGGSAHSGVLALPGRSLCDMLRELSGVATPPDPAAIGAITARYRAALPEG